MILTYQPEGEAPRTFPFRARKIMSVEAEALEKVTGWDYGGEFGQKLMSGSMLARRALVWIFLKRSTPTLRFADVSICMDDVTLDYDVEELDQIAARRDSVSETEGAAIDELLATSGWVPPSERSRALAEDGDGATVAASGPTGGAPA